MLPIPFLKLREEFPNIPLTTFLDITKGLAPLVNDESGLQALREMLAEEEVVARRRVEEETRKLEQQERLLRQRIARFEALQAASLPHNRLKVHVPDGIDPEHTKAIIVHGFLMPGERGAYIGSHALPLEGIRIRVQAKLGIVYRGKAFDQAFSFLVHSGVITSERKRGGHGYALNAKESTVAQKSARRIIRAIHAFLNAG